MNCHTARAALDGLARPGELPPEFDVVSVTEHLQSCPECAVLARQRQQFDLTVGRAMRDVAVPSGLRERLLMNLAPLAATTAEASPQDQDDVSFDESHNHVTRPKSGKTPVQHPLVSATTRRVSRRVALIACSLLLAAGIIWWLFPRTLPRLSLESLHAQLAPLIGTSADQDVPFVAFENGQSTTLPQNHLRAEELREPRSVTVRSLGQSRRAAAYFFEFEITGQSRPIPGVLVVVPLDALEPGSVPSETSFLQSGAIPLAAGVCVSVWREGDLVYLCYVRGTERELRLLRQRSGSA